MSDELKPCPFCGNTEKLDIDLIPADTVFYFIHCPKFSTEGPADLGVSGAIAQWNTRPLEDALAAKVADIERDNADLFAARKVAEDRVAELLEKNDYTYCSFCGQRFPYDDIEATQVVNHIRTCEKHPMRQLEQELSDLEIAKGRDADLAISLAVRVEKFAAALAKYADRGNWCAGGYTLPDAEKCVFKPSGNGWEIAEEALKVGGGE